tara:strand:+ start:9539 stop:10279 length:741 start_codon:yes stop_codon:yes gene_type:complete
MSLGLLSLFSFYSRPTVKIQTKIQEYSEQNIHTLIQNNESLEFLKILPERENQDSGKILNDIALIVDSCLQRKKLDDLTNNQIAIEDLHLGLKNCIALNNELSQCQDQNNQFLSQYTSLMENSLSLYKKLQYPADNSQDKAYTLLFKNHIGLLKQAMNTEFYPYVGFIMADAALRSNDPSLEMIGPVLLTDIIIKYQEKTIVTQYAWVRLNDSIRFGYTGSAGDSTPSSWNTLIQELAYLTQGKTL